MARRRMVQRCAGTVRQRPQVAAVLDLENLLYTQRRISGEAVRAAFVAIVAQLRSLGELRFAVGCCDRWLAAALAPVAVDAGVRLHPCAFGRDCADRELLRRAGDAPAGASVFVIGSGDGAFTQLARAQREAGRRTIVVATPGRISRRLRAAADLVVELPAAAGEVAA